MLKKLVAAVCVLATVGLAAPALAGGYGHGHHGHHHGYYKHRYDGAAVFAGGLLLGALIGHLAAPRPVYVAPPPAVYVPPPPPPTGNCRTIYGTGYLNGRLAEFQGSGCYDAYGNLYAVPGSERFLRYLN
ncbi:MAG: hypothetical protein JSU82_14540 [Rhodospirillales bacterium]|nr:MAG: hypothetical protein JSU82_14540 [Rhodospirillales bacterium]